MKCNDPYGVLPRVCRARPQPVRPPRLEEDVMTTRLLTAPKRMTKLPRQSLGDAVRAMHGRRLAALGEALALAEGPDASLWSRWHAGRVVNQLLSTWFEPESQLVERAGERARFGPTTPLWMAVELIMSLRWQMDHATGLCHHPAEFSRITHKLKAVLEHWCREVEAAVSRIQWQDLSADESHAFTSLLGEESNHVS